MAIVARHAGMTMQKRRFLDKVKGLIFIAYKASLTMLSAKIALLYTLRHDFELLIDASLARFHDLLYY